MRYKPISEHQGLHSSSLSYKYSFLLKCTLAVEEFLGLSLILFQWCILQLTDLRNKPFACYNNSLAHDFSIVFSLQNTVVHKILIGTEYILIFSLISKPIFHI